MPTTKSQCALVYALNALLLFNLTVIVVMLSGTTPKAQTYVERSAEKGSVAAVPERREMSLERVSHEETISTDPVQFTEEVSEPALIVSDHPAVFDEPEAITEKSATDRAVAQVKPKVKKQPAEQNDAPATFFGVGLE
jgi:hypothetical protein